METRAVLVTGASSGIGRECALHLASRGLRVFAGVRKSADADSLSKSGLQLLTPVMLDVADPASIRSAVHAIQPRLEKGGAFGLVNNAGITVLGPMELLDIESLRRQFEVNVFGPMAVTQAFLPLLRAHRGRVVIMGSLFGKIALPFVAPYAAAKFALEAIADSLCLELRPWGIAVSLIEPGNIATPIWSKTRLIMDSFSALPTDKVELYRKTLGNMQRLIGRFAARGHPASLVARTVERALAARRPRTRYLVGWEAKLFGRMAPLVPDRLRHWVVGLAMLRR